MQKCKTWKQLLAWKLIFQVLIFWGEKNRPVIIIGWKNYFVLIEKTVNKSIDQNRDRK